MSEVDPELITLIYHGREERYLEYKSSISWDDNNVKGKLTKAALAMSNLRDGGYIVIGVDDKTGDAHGMSEEDFDSYKQDHVQPQFNKFADPFVEVVVAPIRHDDKRFVVIQIREFLEEPTICKCDGPQNLKKGRIYTRARGKHETIQVPSHVEMREILKMATIKGIRRLHETIHEAGLQIVDSEVEHEKQFSEQLNGL